MMRRVKNVLNCRIFGNCGSEETTSESVQRLADIANAQTADAYRVVNDKRAERGEQPIMIGHTRPAWSDLWLETQGPLE